MSNYSLSRPMPETHQNEFHTAGRRSTLAQLVAKVPIDIVLTEIEADCPVHGKHKWLASRRAVAAGEIGCQKCQLEKDERKKRFVRLRDELLVTMNIPGKHRHESFKDWHLYGTEAVKERLIKIGNFAQDYAKNYKIGQPSILLSGKTGTGKTKIACIIANEIVRQNFHPRMTVLFKRSSDIQSEFNDTWDKSNNKTESAYMNDLATATVLIIDDIGEGDTGFTDNTTTKYRERLSAVIDRRYSRGLPTIITTNMTADEFYEHMGDRATDRLRQNLVSISCVWRSYRDSYNNLQVI